jgi:hypothetical protein
MRMICAGLVVSIAASAAQPASAEILYPWCKQEAEGAGYCGYSSEAQCMQQAGRAFCIQNPRYQGPTNPSPAAAGGAPGKRRSR